jgi:hypothetical protein
MDKQKKAFIGKQSNTMYTCGDTVFVTPQKADIIKGVLLLRKAPYYFT